MTELPAVVIVVPCYNEAERLDGEAFLAFAASGRARLLFVNDGSRDGTAGVLRALQGAAPSRIDVLSLESNVGKGEAVRRGLRLALDKGAEIVGYADADLSTPLDEVARLVDLVARGSAEVAIGARVALLGASIARRPTRHYLGRLFATAASLVLRVPVYDTQCGAKCFRASPAVLAAIETPFLSRWAFDVELLGRLLVGGRDAPPVPLERFLEMPLRRWRDMAGSTLRVRAMAGAPVELLRIRRDLRRRARLAGAR